MTGDRYAFRQRFNRWKQGERYWSIIGQPLPHYADGKDSDLFYKNLYPKNIDTSEYDFAKKVWNYDDQQAMKFVHDIYQMFPDHYEVYAGELPEVVVKPDPNSKSQVTLTTYYPMVSAYPYTGHSKLKTEGGNIIDVKSNDVGYNLITNNCSDATRKALEMASGKKMNNWFFTTPGDVKDFAELLGGRTSYPGYGRAVTKLDLPTEDVRKIAEYSKKLSLEKYRQRFRKIRPVENNGQKVLPLYRGGKNSDNKGGNKSVTTGGAGYIPPAIDPNKLMSSLRQRIYDSVDPFSGYQLKNNLRDFLANKDWSKDYEQLGNEDIEIWGEVGDAGTADAIYAKYLLIPQNKRKFKKQLKQSLYRPTKGGDKNNVYYKLPIDEYLAENIVEDTQKLNVGLNVNSEILSNRFNLGVHTIGKGFDNRGEYRSYFDRWDLNPFNGKYEGVNIPILNKFNDVSMGIGKPVNIYDRIYMDDYYGVKEPTHATYLPEVDVYAHKKKIKPIDYKFNKTYKQLKK